MGERVYDLIIHPYTDSGSLRALKETLASRWSPMSQLYGHAITAFRGSYGEATKFGLEQNDQHATVMPISDSRPIRCAGRLKSGHMWRFRCGQIRPRLSRLWPSMPCRQAMPGVSHSKSVTACFMTGSRPIWSAMTAR
ncbi:hypothetical protein [Asaia astilbis]|uniref:hypothetical protein n=1 Tax=Asaia astilbis TaxID=610244 RepID=UPI001E435594|nr:hypothetical protein [Asaia astilbis]